MGRSDNSKSIHLTHVCVDSSSGHRDRSPSPPSTPSTHSQQTRRACMAIRKADRNLKQLEDFQSSPVKTKVQHESEDVVLVGVLPTVPPTPREITVKVRYRGEIYRVPMRVVSDLVVFISHIPVLVPKQIPLPCSLSPQHCINPQTNPTPLLSLPISLSIAL
ncbi:NFATC2-interacting protein-like [Chiloscyllium plagiosum]|uniref:NFATC2-interacting protein-like n=1 Tax=Chiloscyllium plagiosum TaxID=36176 RepID=UPI001CB86F60|nr:NFATC2-interacting protein-like [Chiloscyllium plagiosum]